MIPFIFKKREMPVASLAQELSASELAMVAGGPPHGTIEKIGSQTGTWYDCGQGCQGIKTDD
jgi:hypothetical protein